MSYVFALPSIQVDAEAAAARRLSWWKRWALIGLIASLVLHLSLAIGSGFIPWTAKHGGDEYLEIHIVARPQDLMTDAVSLVNPQEGQGAVAAAAAKIEVIEATEAPPRPLVTLVEGVAPAAARPAIDPHRLDQQQLLAEPGQDAVGQPAVMTWGSANALDRLSIEISQILWRRKAMIVWCFEETPEVAANRRQIAAHLGQMYDDLGIVQKIAPGDVITGVVSYGPEVRLHTPKPTIDLNEVVRAIDAVPTSNGPSQMCKAVARTISFHQRFSRFTLSDLEQTPTRNSGLGPELEAEDGPAFDRESLLQEERKIVLVLVTATAGDPEENQRHLEETIAQARKAGVRVYVLGREAMFNYPFERLASRQPGAPEIYRGADSGQQEVLLRSLFGRHSGDLPSGFGPYAQARLVRETGGLFFLVPGPNDDHDALERRAMRQDFTRRYVPQLQSREVIAEEIRRSELRRTLMEIVEYLDPVDPAALEQLALPRTFPGANQEFENEARQTVTRAENIFRYYRRMFRKLEKMEPLRAAEPSRRWRANYDMMRADLAVLMARTYEYGVALVGRIKQLPPDDQAPLRVQMREQKKTFNYANSRRYSEVATNLLQRVIDEHPGTPWAARAQAELDRGFGVVAVNVVPTPTATPPASEPSAALSTSDAR